MLPFLATRQAVEDLEAFRVWLKADKLDLYGESYGTQYVQTYAAAHPAHLHSLLLDGPVDLTLTALEYYDEGADAHDEVLAMTLDRCTHDADCRRDVVGRDGLAGYDELAETLRSGPLQYWFVDAAGTLEARSFGLGDLETAAAGYVYGEFDRMLLQRAIAWASRGRLLPLARLAYLSLGQDPDTLAAIPDDTLVGRDVLRRRMHGLRLRLGDGRAAGAGVHRGRRRRGHRRRPGREHLLRRHAVRLLAGPPGDRGPTRLPDDDLVPGLRPRLLDRSGDAVRRGAAGHEPPEQRVPHRPAGWSAHHLRARQRLSGRHDHEVPGRG